MPAQLPSIMKPYEYVIHGFEAFFWISSMFLNGLFFVVLKNTTTVHRNLRLLMANMIMVYCIVAIMRCIQISNHMTNYLSEEVAYWVLLIRRIAITSKTASEVTLLVERVVSTVLADKYEQNKSLLISVGLVSICVSFFFKKYVL